MGRLSARCLQLADAADSKMAEDGEVLCTPQELVFEIDWPSHASAQPEVSQPPVLKDKSPFKRPKPKAAGIKRRQDAIESSPEPFQASQSVLGVDMSSSLEETEQSPAQSAFDNGLDRWIDGKSFDFDQNKTREHASGSLFDDAQLSNNSEVFCSDEPIAKDEDTRLMSSQSHNLMSSQNHDLWFSQSHENFSLNGPLVSVGSIGLFSASESVNFGSPTIRMHYRPNYKRLSSPFPCNIIPCKLPSDGGADGLTPLSASEKADLLRRLSEPPPCNTNPFSPEDNCHSNSQSYPIFIKPKPLTPIKKLRPDDESTNRYGIQCVAAPGASFAIPRLTRYEEDFEEKKVIGTGSFGTVFKCKRRVDGWLYAVKKTSIRGKSETGKQERLSEVYALAALGNHPNVVRYHNAWIEGDFLYIQMELCEGGNLSKYITAARSFPEDDIIKIIKSIALGLEHFHARGMVHLDIKPENIYVTASGEYKIGDLGMTRKHDISRDLIPEGDNRYLARELLQEENRVDLTKVDIFALGILGLELLCRQQPPKSGAEWQSLRDGVMPPVAGYSGVLLQCIQGMINPDAAQRPSATDILKHPLFLSVLEKQNDELRHQCAHLRGQVQEMEKQQTEAMKTTELVSKTQLLSVKGMSPRTGHFQKPLPLPPKQVPKRPKHGNMTTTRNMQICVNPSGVMSVSRPEKENVTPRNDIQGPMLSQYKMAGSSTFARPKPQLEFHRAV